MARSRRPRDRCAGRSSISSRPATQLAGDGGDERATRSVAELARDGRSCCAAIPDTGRRRADRRSRQAIAIERQSARHARPTLVRRARARAQRIAVVSDRDHARGARRARRARARRASARSQSIVLDAKPHADADTVAARRARRAAHADALVAVGSGTINDLCKYRGRAGRQALRRVCDRAVDERLHVAQRGDHRRRPQESLPAHSPSGVFFDLAVLAAAPPRMIRAGLGDSLCRRPRKPTGCSRIICVGTPYRERAVRAAGRRRAGAVRRARGADARRPRRDGRLVRTLVLSGLGMAIFGSSYPASQGEHLISHYIDMFAPAGPRRLSSRRAGRRGDADDGAAAGRGCSPAGPPTLRIRSRDDRARRCAHRFGAEARRCRAGTSSRAKRLDAEPPQRYERVIADRGMRFVHERQRVRAFLRNASRRHAARGRSDRRRAESGSPTAFYAGGRTQRAFLRDRYTFLDLADDAGTSRPARGPLSHVARVAAGRQRTHQEQRTRRYPGAPAARGHRAHRDARARRSTSRPKPRGAISTNSREAARSSGPTAAAPAVRSSTSPASASAAARTRSSARRSRAPRRTWWSRAMR